MVALKAEISVPFLTGDPADVSINVWSFEVDDDTEPNYIEVAGFLSAFYNELSPFFSQVTDPANSTLTVWVRSDATPQVPRFTTPIDLGEPTSTFPLPEEVAAVLSFKGTPLSGVNPASRRGRVYLGPLSSGLASVGANGRTIINDSFLLSVVDATEAANAELTTAGNSHTVWSPTTSENVVIATYSMDNAWDTQRRRGTNPTDFRSWDA